MIQTVLIDNGHGINTFGKKSPLLPNGKQLFEWEYSRALANKLIPLLEVNGIKAVKLVPEDKDIPLVDRTKRANKYKSEHLNEQCIFISLHGNAAGNGGWQNAQGWECFTTKGQNNSDKLAECLYDAFQNNFKERKIRTDKTDGDRDKEADFTVIKLANMPAVLTENFFYDNKEECEWMLQDSTQERIAMAHLEGILRYFKLK